MNKSPKHNVTVAVPIESKQADKRANKQASETHVRKKNKTLIHGVALTMSALRYWAYISLMKYSFHEYISV